MKKIIIKTDKKSSYLRREALTCILDFERDFMKKKKTGILNGVLWDILRNDKTHNHQIYVYHTKTSIVADVRVK